MSQETKDTIDMALNTSMMAAMMLPPGAGIVAMVAIGGGQMLFQKLYNPTSIPTPPGMETPNRAELDQALQALRSDLADDRFSDEEVKQRSIVLAHLEQVNENFLGDSGELAARTARGPMNMNTFSSEAQKDAWLGNMREFANSVSGPLYDLRYTRTWLRENPDKVAESLALYALSTSATLLLCRMNIAWELNVAAREFADANEKYERAQNMYQQQKRVWEMVGKARGLPEPLPSAVKPADPADFEGQLLRNSTFATLVASTLDDAIPYVYKNALAVRRLYSKRDRLIEERLDYVILSHKLTSGKRQYYCRDKKSGYKSRPTRYRSLAQGKVEARRSAIKRDMRAQLGKEYNLDAMKRSDAKYLMELTKLWKKTRTVYAPT